MKRDCLFLQEGEEWSPFDYYLIMTTMKIFAISHKSPYQLNLLRLICLLVFIFLWYSNQSNQILTKYIQLNKFNKKKIFGFLFTNTLLNQ